MPVTLTKQHLDEMEKHLVFSVGFSTDNAETPFGCHGKRVKWVAKRGEINDWAIYYDIDRGQSFEEVQRIGAKLLKMETIQALVPCDKDALSLYRFN